MSELAHRLRRLQGTLIAENRQAPGLFGEIARMEGLLAETYRDRVAYELLQNSDDAGSIRVEITTLAGGSFRWANDGRPLDPADVEALCRSASSTKRRGDAIGYRGIGFKSLAAVAARIEVSSADVTFAFDRSKAAALLGEAPSAVPLIRIPADIHAADWVDGVTFTVARRNDAEAGFRVDPLSLLFLRNVEEIVTRSASGAETVRIQRVPGGVTLHDSTGEARFAVLQAGTATVAVPLDARALALTGVRGRLACFLPLDDEAGLPVIVSGDLLTDPSRTHAVVSDESTLKVLADGATAIADALCTPVRPIADRVWELLLTGEDLRSMLVAPTPSPGKALLTFLRDEMKSRELPFAWSPLPLEREDVAALFPEGAPVALYSAGNQASARALRTVLGLSVLDFSARLSGPNPPALSVPLRERLASHLSELARTHGRALTAAEQTIVDSVAAQSSAGSQIAAPIVLPVTVPKDTAWESLEAVISRWRVAELSVMEYLNARGWRLHDVSAQNVGYDLDGSDANGEPVRLEVKKVDRPDARFAMTNNEMSLMLTRPGGYLVALLVGDGRYARLMLLDPAQDGLTRERVCRRWDWEFTDWSRLATRVD